MGLSGRKVKQRIGADPRNLTWADDAAKFGTNYLSKFGWDASKGLGVEGDGRTSHIKVSHKLDMLGIGAAQQKDPNGIAWKQNKDFESLLKRLNEAAAAEETNTPSGEAKDKEGGVDEGETASEKKEKKRKRKKDREGATEEKAKKRRKSEDSGDSDKEPVKSASETAEVEVTPVVPPKPYLPRYRAHRARAIASKSIASKSSASIAEILGIAPTPSSSAVASGSGTPGKLTPLDDGPLTLEKLTTSTKSVADYFKEKLLARSSGTATPHTPQQDVKMEDSYEPPRGGLGSSRVKIETKSESLDIESQRIGLSKFSSLMSATFLSATASISAPPISTPSESTLETLPVLPVVEEQVEKTKRRKHSKNEKDVEKDNDARKEKDKKPTTEPGADKTQTKEERRRLKAEKKARKGKKSRSKSHSEEQES